mgnify:CR=1 FL=1
MRRGPVFYRVFVDQSVWYHRVAFGKLHVFAKASGLHYHWVGVTVYYTFAAKHKRLFTHVNPMCWLFLFIKSQAIEL